MAQKVYPIGLPGNKLDGMKDLATQAYISYLHKMIEALEEIKEHQALMIRILEDQVSSLTQTAEIYRESHEALKTLIVSRPE